MCRKKLRIFWVEKTELKKKVCLGWKLETHAIYWYLYWSLCSPVPLFSEADLTLTWGDRRSGEAAAPWLDRDRVPAQWDTCHVTVDTCYNRSDTFEAASEGGDEVSFMFSSSWILWIICKEEFQSSSWDREYVGMQYEYCELHIYFIKLSVICDLWRGRNRRVNIIIMRWLRFQQ